MDPTISPTVSSLPSTSPIERPSLPTYVSYSLAEALNREASQPPREDHLQSLHQMFLMPGYKQYLEGLRALQAAEVRKLLEGDLNERSVGRVEGALTTLETLARYPEQVDQMLKEEEQNAATGSRRKR
jgi:hypothetical protein